MPPSTTLIPPVSAERGIVTPLSVTQKLRMSLCSEHVRRLNIIDTEDYGSVMKKTREILTKEGLGAKASDQYLERGILNLKLYYAIALLDPANGHAVSAEVDPFWHAHMLHSEQYMRFCSQVVGGYMHHTPLDKGNSLQMKNIRTLYEYTLDVLGRIFTDVDREFWPQEILDANLICWHKGNQDAYPEIQPLRLFCPDERGTNYAFA